MRKPVLLAGILVSATLAVSACSVDGHATRPPVKLDTGIFQVERSTEDAPSVTRQAAIALGESMPLRTELDPQIDNGTIGTGPITTLAQLDVIDDGAEDLTENKEFQFGFCACGNDKGTFEDIKRLSAAVLRFSSPEAAQRAVQPNVASVDKNWQAANQEYDKSRRIETPTLSGGPAGAIAISNYSPKNQHVNMKGFAASGSDLLYVTVDGYSRADADKLVVKTLDALKRASDQARDVKKVEELTNEDFLVLSVPYAKDDDRYMFDGSVIGPRAFATKFHQSTEFFDMFTAAGVDLVSQRATTVYRTASDAQATKLKDAVETTWLADSGYRKVAGPLDLPTATCIGGEGSDGDSWYGCTLTDGRYFATSGEETLKEAQQAIAAQYEMFRKFG